MIHTLILSNKNENIAALIIFCEIINYINVFFKKNAEKLSKHKEDDHVIELNE